MMNFNVNFNFRNANVYILSGATATGKTNFSYVLADEITKIKGIRPLILNFDSLLFYKEIKISSAPPSKEQLESFPHDFFGTYSLLDPTTAGRFSIEAKAVIDQALAKNCPVILVGGSGFYLKSLCTGFTKEEANEKEEKKQKEKISLLVEKIWENSPEEARELLKEQDPLSYNKVHPNDHYRQKRALIYFLLHNKPLGPYLEKTFFAQHYWDFLGHPNWQVLHLSLSRSPHDLKRRIFLRAKNLLEEGLIEEAIFLEKHFEKQRFQWGKSIGLLESLEYHQGKISYDFFMEKIVTRTWHLAKGQRTFFQTIFPKLIIHFEENMKCYKDDSSYFLRCIRSL